MTVAELDARMPADEFLRWQIYHGRRMQQRELAEKMTRR